jgi:peptidyl-prolyl cis-trans isomerase SurA
MLAAAGVVIGVVLGGGAARATIVERVVAVVGDRPILLSELRERALPDLRRVAREDVSYRAAVESELLRRVLDHMVDERLVALAAERARVRVSEDEIDRAVLQVAANAGVTVKELVAEVARVGLTGAAYREELGRQLLEGKMFELRVKQWVDVGDASALARQLKTWLEELRRGTYVDLRL